MLFTNRNYQCQHQHQHCPSCISETSCTESQSSQPSNGVCFGVTIALLGSLIGLARLNPWGLAFDQYYYLGTLSCLLIHYMLDGWLFSVSNLRGVDVGREPYAAPALA